jgi:hypothetical protein
MLTLAVLPFPSVKVTVAVSSRSSPPVVNGTWLAVAEPMLLAPIVSVSAACSALSPSVDPTWADAVAVKVSRLAPVNAPTTL